MNSETWQQNNHHYLAVSLQWLRLRLLVAQTVASSEGVPQESNSLITELDQVAEERGKHAAADQSPGLVTVAARFGLSEFERDILLLCAALEFDPGFADLYAGHPANRGHQYPTFALCLALFDSPTWDALAATGPLRRFQLLDVNQPGATPLTASALRVDEHILDFIKGLTNRLDDRLLSMVTPVTFHSDLSESQSAVVQSILSQVSINTGRLSPTVVQLMGSDPESSLSVAGAACRKLNVDLVRIDAADLPSTLTDMEVFSRLWQRESLLLPVVLYIDAGQIDSHTAEGQTLQRFLQKATGLTFVALRETPLKLSGFSVVVDAPKPTTQEQSQAWQKLLKPMVEKPKNATQIAQRLAGQFDLNLTDIQLAAKHAINPITLQMPQTDSDISEHLWATCRDLTRPRLDVLAQRLDAKATWEDLVVPSQEKRLLEQIADQVKHRHLVYQDWGFGLKMNRGFGITALFAGDSGTGKTMAAEVIANALQLNLYRIDLSAVVSKYIGETEKNLRKLFDAAEQGGAILFFDEADALFGKRSEVKDSHDRYANIEINYLLQRMESFSGLAILATNMKSALDVAFMRRLRFIVEFPFPSAQERKLIWEKAFPKPDSTKGGKGTPIAGPIDYTPIARFNLSGGNIHSIALNAAFLAASHGHQVNMMHILDAIRSELRKLNKPINEAEFRQMELMATSHHGDGIKPINVVAPAKVLS